MAQGSNPRGGGGDLPHPFRPALDPASLKYNGYKVSYMQVKWLGHSIDHPPLSSAEVKGRVELHLYYCSGPSWPVLG